MDHREKVEFLKRELEKARKDFPSGSNEVRIAEASINRALNEVEDASLSEVPTK